MASSTCKHPEESIEDDVKSGDRVCTDCGLVILARAFCGDADLYSTGSSSSIGEPERTYGQPDYDKYNPFLEKGFLNSKNKNAAKRYSQIQKAAVSAIEQYGTRLYCSSSAVDTAVKMFMKVQSNRKVTIRTVDAYAAACLQLSCQSLGVPRTLKEIILATQGVPQKEINTAVTRITEKHDLGIHMVIFQASELIPRFCNMLGIPWQLSRVAVHISEKTKDIAEMRSKLPDSIAAGAIYMVSLTRTDVKARKYISMITKEQLFPADYVAEVELPAKVPRQ